MVRCVTACGSLPPVGFDGEVAVPAFARLSSKYANQLAAEEEGDAVMAFGMMDIHQTGKAPREAIAVCAESVSPFAVFAAWAHAATNVLRSRFFAQVELSGLPVNCRP